MSPDTAPGSSPTRPGHEDTPVARGHFIVFEGGEASGKSTQAALLAEHLGAVATREPGGTDLGERLRSLLLDPATGSLQARTELLLMVAARAEHVATVIEPALRDGRDVVCDRFSGSSIAYQAYGRGLDPGEVARVSQWAAGGLEPDLVVLLDVGGGTSAARLGEVRDRLEAAGEAFHARVRDGFVRLAEADPSRWLMLDGNDPVDVIAARVAEAVRTRLG